MYFFEPDASMTDMDEALLNYFHQLPTPETRQAIVDTVRILTSVILGQNR